MNALLKFIESDEDARTWSRGVHIQARVVMALMLRDAMARYGHENLGFFWVIGEPMLLTAGVMILWTLTGQSHGASIGVAPFALTGYSYITMWRHLVGRGTRGISRNASLFFLNRVKFFDVLLAGALLEIVAIFAAFLLVYMPLALLGLAPVVHDPLLSIAGWLLAGWFGFAFSLVLVGISEFFEASEKFIQPLMYLTIPATGVFFMLDWLPPQGQNVLKWSPLVSGIEMFRGGIFPPDIPIHYDAVYLLCWCVGLTAVGLPMCHYAQKHIQIR